jgi:thiol-disulfide isomerase/thioredoxin
MIHRIRQFIACMAAGILSAITANSQELTIGQKCPDILLRNILFYDRNQMNLSEFSGKLLILDFWGTGCTACIQAFSTVDSLQKKFNNQLQFIAVNRESPDSTIRFFRRRSHIEKPAVPFVTGDTLLSSLFPHLYVPHHVWIDSNKIVRYITDGYNATAEHIQQFLDGNPPALNEKKYEAKNDYNSALMAIADKKGLDHLESYSLLLHCISGMSFGNQSGMDEERPGTCRITQNCVSIVQLYTTAFSENGRHDFSSSNTVLLKARDKSKYMVPTDNNLWDQWVSNDSYIYELMVPAADAATIYKNMQRDLRRYFNLKGTIEKRMVKCMALVRTTAKDQLKTKGGQPFTNFWVMTDSPVKRMTNLDFAGFTDALSVAYRYRGFARPLIDNSNYKGKIDIEISANAWDNFDIHQLNRELGRYGLALREQNAQREVLILQEE